MWEGSSEQMLHGGRVDTHIKCFFLYLELKSGSELGKLWADGSCFSLKLLSCTVCVSFCLILVLCGVLFVFFFSSDTYLFFGIPVFLVHTHNWTCLGILQVFLYNSSTCFPTPSAIAVMQVVHVLFRCIGFTVIVLKYELRSMKETSRCGSRSMNLY